MNILGDLKHFGFNDNYQILTILPESVWFEANDIEVFNTVKHKAVIKKKLTVVKLGPIKETKLNAIYRTIYLRDRYYKNLSVIVHSSMISKSNRLKPGDLIFVNGELCLEAGNMPYIKDCSFLIESEFSRGALNTYGNLLRGRHKVNSSQIALKIFAAINSEQTINDLTDKINSSITPHETELDYAAIKTLLLSVHRPKNEDSYNQAYLKAKHLFSKIS